MSTRAQPSATLPGPSRAFTTLPLVGAAGLPYGRANHMAYAIYMAYGYSHIHIGLGWVTALCSWLWSCAYVVFFSRTAN
eukprot:scaffold11295_cov120-Isochrysis_galbana.AAC.5